MQNESPETEVRFLFQRQQLDDWSKSFIFATMTKNKWTALFLSNFLGIFNDNFLKNCIIFIAVSWALPDWLTQSQLISFVSASLVLPYLFLSPLAGRLAVIYSKKSVFKLGKLLEIPVLAVACVAFYFHLPLTAVLCVLLMGIISCLYSPAKYSLIRDIGGEEGVSYGSGVFEMMAFLGILTGTVVASIAADYYNQWAMMAGYLGLAIAGYFVTRSIRANELPENKDEKGTLNPIRFIIDSYTFASRYKHVNSAVFGASAFWLIGGMLQMNLVIHTQHQYHTNNSTTGMVMACAAIGIALGTLTAGKISGSKVKKGLILPSIACMTMLFALVSFLSMSMPAYIVTIFSIAFAGGLFQIPCLSIIQNAGLGRKVGDIFGYLNLITFILVLAGTALFSGITYLTGENSHIVFASISIICGAIFVFYLVSSADFIKESRSFFNKENK